MKILTLILILLNTACATTGSYIPVNSEWEAKSENCKIDTFMPGEEIKRNHKIIGVFSIQEMGLSVNCGWKDALEKTRIKACSVGADAVDFLQVDTPSIDSTCYRTKANLIRYQN